MGCSESQMDTEEGGVVDRQTQLTDYKGRSKRDSEAYRVSEMMEMQVSGLGGWRSGLKCCCIHEACLAPPTLSQDKKARNLGVTFKYFILFCLPSPLSEADLWSGGSICIQICWGLEEAYAVFYLRCGNPGHSHPCCSGRGSPVEVPCRGTTSHADYPALWPLTHEYHHSPNACPSYPKSVVTPWRLTCGRLSSSPWLR